MTTDSSLLSAVRTSRFTHSGIAHQFVLAMLLSVSLLACEQATTAAPADGGDTPAPAPTVPVLSNLPDQVLTANTAIAPAVFANTGADVNADGCLVDTTGGKPDLPAGLSLGVVSSSGKMTCQISGTPTKPTNGSITVSVQGVGGTGMSLAQVAISVVSAVDPPSFSSVAAQIFPQGLKIGDLVIENTGGDIRQGGCLVDTSAGDQLPAGLRAESVVSGGVSTCQIVGIPLNVTSAPANVTISGTGVSGTASVTISISVEMASAPTQPPFLPSPSTTQAFTQGSPALITLLNIGGRVEAGGCTLASGSPALPNGLELGIGSDSSGNISCQISGTPLGHTNGEDLVLIIAAANAAGAAFSSTRLTINISPSVVDNRLPMLISAQEGLVFARGDTIDPIVFANEGGSVSADGCALVAGGTPLPGGLGLSVVDVEGTRTCQITGTVAAETNGPVTIEIVGSNANGQSGIARVSLTVNRATTGPELENIDTVQIFTAGFPISAVNFVNAAGSVSANGCAEILTGGQSTLPAGLEVRTATVEGKDTCQIAGTPTTPTDADAVVMVRGFNDISTSTASVTIRVIPDASEALAPILVSIAETQTYPHDESGIQIAFDNSGDSVLEPGGCALAGSSNALPAGLSIDTVSQADNKISCQIRGTASAATAAEGVLVTVTGTNAQGSSDATVTIVVTAPVVVVDPPALMNQASAFELPVGVAITAIVFDNSGGSVDENGCALDAGSALPMGLVISTVDSSGTTTCQITGAPDMGESGDYTIVVRGANTGGVSIAQAELTIITAPSLANITEVQMFTVDVGIPLVNFTNSGGDVQAGGCAVDTSGGKDDLPAGLMVRTATVSGVESCQIFGIPSAATTSNASVTITGTNAVSSSSATVMIGVSAPVVALLAPSLADLTGTRTFVQDQANIQIVFVNSGGNVMAGGCALAPGSNALPAGLTVDLISGAGSTTSCQISGTPTMATSGPVDVTIRAENSMSTDDATVSINITPPPVVVEAPALVNAMAQTVEVGEFIDPIVFANGGGSVGASGCGFDTGSPMPEGLRVSTTTVDDVRTCQIIGSPAATTPMPVRVSVRGSNSAASSVATVAISVISVPDLADIDEVQEFTVDVEIAVVGFTNSGGNVDDCVLAGATSLPAGLNLRAATVGGARSCQIFGTPSATTTADVDVMVTGQNPVGSDTASVTIRIVPAVIPPVAPDLADIAEVQTFTVGDENIQILFGNAGDSVRADGCSVNPGSDPLPTGLDVSEAGDQVGKISCQIAGTPEMANATGGAQYTIRAENGVGANTATVTIDIMPPPVQAPVLVNAPDQMFERGVEITPVVFTNNGDAVDDTGCAVAPGSTLPPGLMISTVTDNDVLTCQISGTPQGTTGGATISVQVAATNAANPGAAARASVRITINLPDRPVLRPNLASPGAQTLTQGVPITPIVFVNSGGVVARTGGCQLAAGSSLPPGLELSTDEAEIRGCQITGIPFAVATEQTVGVTATNIIGSGDATVAITVVANGSPALPVLANASPRALAVGSPIEPIIFANTGGSATSCSVEPVSANFPAALTAQLVAVDDILACQLVGTLTEVVAGEVTANVVATNGAGTASGSVTVSVGNPDRPALGSITARLSLPVNRPASAIVFDNTGGSVNNPGGCRLAPAEGFADLPNGLSLSVVDQNGTATCRITGTPTMTTNAPVLVRIEGVNTGRRQISNPDGSTALETFEQGDLATVQINIVPTPLLTDISGVRSLTRLLPAASIVFANTGSSVRASNGCALAGGTLPVGLALERVMLNSGVFTCAITGVPTLAALETAYDVVGTDDNGQSSSALVSIVVEGLPEPPQCAGLMGDVETADYPITGGFPATRLFLVGNHSNGEIQNEFLFRYKGSNIYQAAGVFDAIDAAAGYDAANTTFVIRSDDSPATTLLLIAPSAQADVYELFEAASVARTDDATGLVADSVALAQDRAFSFTLTTGSTANPANGADAAMLTINACAAPALPSTSAANFVYNEMGVNFVVNAEDTGGPVEECALAQSSAALPGTLAVAVSADRTQCVISGNVGATSGATTHSLVASNNAGMSTSALTVTVGAAPVFPVPTLVSPTIGANASFDVGVAIGSAIVIENSAGDVSIAANSCQFIASAAATPPASPVTTANGLEITTDTTNDRCSISGSPDSGGRLEFFVVAANARGDYSNVASFQIVVNAPVPVLEAPEDPALVDLGEASHEITIPNISTASTIDTCFLREDSTIVGVAKNIDGSACIATIDTGRINNSKGFIQFDVAARNSGGMAGEFVRVGFFYSSASARPDLSPAGHFSRRLELTRGEDGLAELVNVGGDVATSGCYDYFVCGLPELADLGLRIESAMGRNGRRTCHILGSPTRAAIGFPMTIVGSNSSGSSGDVLYLDIEPGDPVAPRLLNPVLGQYTVGFEIEPIVFPNLGDAVMESNGCNAISGLPDGLTVSRLAAPRDDGVVGLHGYVHNVPSFFTTDRDTGGVATCRITGRPLEPTAGPAPVTMMAINAAGAEMKSFDLDIRPLPMPSAVPALTNIAEFEFFVAGGRQALVFENTGGNVSPLNGCRVDTSGGKPDLPAGLSFEFFNNSGTWTCRIVGDAEAVAAVATISFIAENALGMTTATAVIGAVDLPPILEPVRQRRTVYVGRSADIVTLNSGRPVTSCALAQGSSPLPNGLMPVVTETTGAASCGVGGMATETAPLATYTLLGTASNGLTDTVMVTFRVRPAGDVTGAPNLTSGGTATIEQLVWTIPPNGAHYLFENTGADVRASPNTCVLDTSDGKPALPAGLSVFSTIDSDERWTCGIRGRITENHPDVTVTVVGSNNNGSSSATVTIRVRADDPPVLAVPVKDIADPYPGEGDESFFECSDNGSCWSNIYFGNSGNAITRCESEPALPRGMWVSAARYVTDSETKALSTPTCAILTARAAANALEIRSRRSYTITGYTRGGSSDSATIEISVKPYPNYGLCPAIGHGVPYQDLSSTAGAGWYRIFFHSPIFDPELHSCGEGIHLHDCPKIYDRAAVVACELDENAPAPSLPPGMTQTQAEALPLMQTYGHGSKHPDFLPGEELLPGELPIPVQTFAGPGQPSQGAPSLSPAGIANAFTGPSGAGFTQALNSIVSVDGVSGSNTRVYRAEGRVLSAIYPFGSLPSPGHRRVTSVEPEDGYSDTFMKQRIESGFLGLCPANRIPPSLTLAPADNQTIGYTHPNGGKGGGAIWVDFDNSGGDVEKCEISPALPAGVGLSNGWPNGRQNPGRTCAIIGYPTETLEPTTYTLKATAEGGYVDTIDVELAVYALRLGQYNIYISDNYASDRCSGRTTNPGRWQDLGDGYYRWSYTVTYNYAGGRTWVAPLSAIIHCGTPSTLEALGQSAAQPSALAGGFGQAAQAPFVGPGAASPPPSQQPQARLLGNASVSIAAGGSHSCALSADGDLSCWGLGAQGQLAPGGSQDQAIPALVDDQNWIYHDAGKEQSCAINDSYELYCWGSSQATGHFPSASTESSGQGGEIVVGWSQVSAGDGHNCAISRNNDLYCWGENTDGQLGLGYRLDQPAPVAIATFADWLQVSAGAGHTCAINTDSELWCWGRGDAGQTGLGVFVDQLSPAQVGVGSALESGWAQVSAGDAHTCAVRDSGELYCWGKQANGRLGAGESLLSDQSYPVLVGQSAELPSGWAQVSAGKLHTCATQHSGALYCWGGNADGQLGAHVGEGLVDIHDPAQVGADSDWQSASAGGAHSCAVKTSGDIYCWGSSANGRLGFATELEISLPSIVVLDTEEFSDEEAAVAEEAAPAAN